MQPHNDDMAMLVSELFRVRRDTGHTPRKLLCCVLAMHYYKGSNLKVPTLPRCVRACLDSGSSLHLCPYTTVVNGNDVVRVFGFDGSAQNTLGTGALSFAVASQNGNITHRHGLSVHDITF